LKEIKAMRRDVEQKLVDSQGWMFVLAQAVAMVVHSVSIVNPRPPLRNPFNGEVYWWIWHGVKMRIWGLSSRNNNSNSNNISGTQYLL
jgi:hypothetical protein